jgi:hypothetical protein
MCKRMSCQALAAGALVLAAACSDQNEQPVAPSSQPESPPLQSAGQGSPEDPISLGRTVPGFGGFYLDSRGMPVVYLKDAAQRTQAERALAPFLSARGLAASQLRVLPAKYDWAQLERWFNQASAEVLAEPGSVFVDADEASNKVAIGVERGAAARFRGIVVRLGIPADAVVVQETEPIRFATTLRDRVRPIVGGLQINFPGFLCTLGFNAIRSGQNSFITNSHCTDTQGGTEGTPYWQPLESVDPVQIGTEVDDPLYVRGTGDNGCPRGRRCRFSDASRAAYAPGITFTLGSIARTTGPNNNSITIDPANASFSINREGSASVGQTANKIGRTTGWTQGAVTRTCVNTGVLGSNIVQLCQTFVSAGVGAGDSGSPVFIEGRRGVTLVGILWGGSGSTTYVFSPIANIEQELGSLTTS